MYVSSFLPVCHVANRIPFLPALSDQQLNKYPPLQTANYRELTKQICFWIFDVTVTFMTMSNCHVQEISASSMRASGLSNL